VAISKGLQAEMIARERRNCSSLSQTWHRTGRVVSDSRFAQYFFGVLRWQVWEGMATALLEEMSSTHLKPLTTTMGATQVEDTSEFFIL
jgi:hypothetical protein